MFLIDTKIYKSLFNIKTYTDGVKKWVFIDLSNADAISPGANNKLQL